MVQPQQVPPLLERLVSEASAPPQDAGARGRQSKLTFAATIIASRSNCACEPCRLLRATLDNLIADARQEIATDVSPAPPATVEG